MSFDLYVFDTDVPDDEGSIGQLLEGPSQPGSALTALCSRRGLTLYDPQGSLVLRPTGPSTSASTKRRWWKRDR